MEIRRALVLSGGGAKGIYEVGCLSRLLLDEPELDFDYLLGVSAGALNAAYLAQAPMTGGFGSAGSRGALRKQVSSLEAIWKGIRGPEDIYEGSIDIGLWTKIRVGVCGRDSLVDARPIRKLIDEHVNGEKVLESGRFLHIGAASLDTGHYVRFSERTPNLPRAVKASTAVPGIFSPIRWGDDLLVDGAIRNNTPLGVAYAARPELEIVVIQSSPVKGGVEHAKWDMSRESALDVLYRIAVIMADEVQVDDLEGAKQWNFAIGTLLRAKQQVPQAAAEIQRALDEAAKVHVPTRVFAPQEPLLVHELVFEKSDMDEMWRKGQEDARNPRMTF